ncbi:hypothetical protein ACQKH5_12485 [Hyphomonas sp. NPDC076900]|uniref:hypothetical protein n=1 Tax=unclassified Hyphomonas TaxID=2630699 RepID=UPI003D0458E7
MLSTLELDQPCSIEDTVRQLRALACLLTQSKTQADVFVEIALSRFINLAGSIDMNAIPFPLAYSYLRQELMSLHGAGETKPVETAPQKVHCLPFPVREAALLHAVVNLDVSQIATLQGDTKSSVESRINLARQFGCQNCPAHNTPPLAA